MPLYEFDCPGCGQPFETRVKMSEVDDVTCPNCGSHHVSKRMSTFAVKGRTPASTASPVIPSGGL